MQYVLLSDIISTRYARSIYFCSYSLQNEGVPWSWHAWFQECVPLGKIKVCDIRKHRLTRNVRKKNMFVWQIWTQFDHCYKILCYWLRDWLIEARRLLSPEEVEMFHLNTMDKEISLLEKELSITPQRIGFCHNDLQYGNIMLDEVTNSVTIIVSFSLC